MKIWKALVAVEGSNGLFMMDAIERAGAMWLVTHWHDKPGEPKRKPARIIRLDSVRHQGKFGEADFVVSYPLPKGVRDGSPIGSPYVVLENPEIPDEPTTAH